MNKILTLFAAALFLFSAANAQKTFSGTIHYDMKVIGESADQLAAFMPTGTDYAFRDGDIRMEIQGGMTAAMMGPIIVKSEDGISYMLKDAEKTAYKFERDNSEGEEDDAPKPVITKEDETITILGYKCQKYKVIMDTPEGQVEQFVWAASDLKLSKTKKKTRGSNNLEIDGIDGTPLKKMTNIDMMGMSFTQIEVASKIEKSKPDKSLFEIPADYEIKKGDASLFGGMGQ